MRKGWGLLAAVMACSCGLERLDIVEQRVPPPVWAAFQGSCSCHVGMDMGGVEFDEKGAFVGPPLVVARSLEEGAIAETIAERTMPPGGFEMEREADEFIIMGWIASGAELEDVEDDTDTTTSDGDSTTTAAAGTTTTDSTTMDDGSSGGDETEGPPPFDAFVPVLEIFQASCGGSSCHRDGGTISPVLEDAVAYDNLVGQSSNAPDGLPYVTAGDSSQSHLMRRLNASAGFPVMPIRGPLPQAEIDIAAGWIDSGALR